MPSIPASLSAHAHASRASFAETRVAMPGAGSAGPSTPSDSTAVLDPRVAPANPTAARAPPGDGASGSFANVLRGLGREVQRGESLMRSAMARGMRIGSSAPAGSDDAGTSLEPGELISLQAGVYHYAEAIDLASRLVDRASSSVKTVLQG